MTENIKNIIVSCLPKDEIYLGEFLFLTPDTLWEGRYNGQNFVTFAEDRWLYAGGMFLAVTEDGAVYKGDLEDNSLFQYCAAGLPQFMEIMGGIPVLTQSSHRPRCVGRGGL